jgi:spore coat polysaccharide biosynthesis predicted glycosyltransferase SpsG
MNLTILTRAAAETGLGHVMRCLAIAAAARARGAVVTFRLPASDLPLPARTGFPVLPPELPPPPGTVLIDDPGLSATTIAALIGPRHRVSAFDDACCLDGLPLHAVIDYTRHHRDAAASRVLTGPACFPLRGGFRRHDGPRDGILVSFGGSDVFGLSMVTAAALREALPAVPVRLVLGAAAPESDSMPTGITVLRDPPDFPRLCAEAAVAVAAAGGTAFELAYLGTPALLVSLSPDQKRMAEIAAAAGCARRIATGTEATPRQLAANAAELYADATARTVMTAAGPRLIDGNGADRIAAAILATGQI